LLVVVENYPQLRSNENFLRLQDELAGTENRIAVERRRYNEAVQDYNTFISLFPNSLVASLSGFTRNDAYFKTEEGARQAPKVNFGAPNAPGGAGSGPEASTCKALEFSSSKRRIFRQREPLADFRDDLFRGLRGVDRNGIRGLLEIRELAGEDLLAGVVPFSRMQPPRSNS